jgi:hypothetical protein
MNNHKGSALINPGQRGGPPLIKNIELTKVNKNKVKTNINKDRIHTCLLCGYKWHCINDENGYCTDYEEIGSNINYICNDCLNCE